MTGVLRRSGGGGPGNLGRQARRSMPANKKGVREESIKGTMEQKTLEVSRAKAQTVDGNTDRPTADPPAALLQSLSGFFDLNRVLSEFTRQWHSLHGDLDSILSSIDLRSRELGDQGAVEAPAAPTPPKVMDSGEELLSICESSSGKNLRKFVIIHLSDVVWLRREVPAAIRWVPSPAKLVFGSLGRFYLRGRKLTTAPSMISWLSSAGHASSSSSFMSYLDAPLWSLRNQLRRMRRWLPYLGGPGLSSRAGFRMHLPWMLSDCFSSSGHLASHKNLGIGICTTCFGQAT